jgi:hypothetical protein
MTSTPQAQNSNPTPSKQSSPINSCADLPLETYIQISIDSDHTRLGEGDTAAAWAAIHAEFDSLTGGISHASIFRLSKDINFMSAKLDVIYGITEEMRKYYVPEYGEMLKEYGYNYEWVLVDEETYHKQIDSIESQAKIIYVQLQAKRKEWDNLAKPGAATKITREYFEDWIVELSEYNGFNIDTQTTSTYRFAVMIKRRNANPNKSDANKKT